MPGWHEATRELREQGRIQQLGIIQEQHPERARLFMQWKRMSWPILVDPLDRLGVSGVPITLAIDEHGIVRKAGLRPGDLTELQDFLASDYSAPAQLPEPERPQPEPAEPAPGAGGAAWLERGDALFTWGGAGRLDAAIDAYRRAAAEGVAGGSAQFRLGVALRARHDSDARHHGDFADAVASWQAALDADPNQYIWRRRIQQYGPRLDKPYPFYDWVPKAREAIRARGEVATPLPVEPGGAEFAAPAESFQALPNPGEEPDPGDRVHRDGGELIRVETAVVPPRAGPGDSVRVHLTFRPIPERLAHWNNEVEPLRLWLRPPPGYEVGSGTLESALPPEPVTREARRLEFELLVPEDAASGRAAVPGYALYYVCEDVDGTCLYRRQDVAVELEVRP